MANLYEAMLKCLGDAQKQLEEADGFETCVMLISSEKIVLYGSAAATSDEFLENMLLCAWDTLRKMNPDLTPDGFAQAAYATALRKGTKEREVSFLSLLQDHALNE